MISFGEIGLAGEVRPVKFGSERISEAAKQGFRLAVVPRSNVPNRPLANIDVVGVETMVEALETTFG